MSKWEIFVNVLEKNGRFGVTYPKDLTLFELDLWEKFRNDEPIYTSSSSGYGFGHSSYKSKSKKKSRSRSKGSKKGKRRVSRNSYKKKSK
jgi:hypothetical protein